jgi:hypothetical protein
MTLTLRYLLSWSEVWTPLIVLFFLFFRRSQPRYLKPVIVYLILALCINLASDIIADYKKFLPSWAQSNNPLYNLHSLTFFICFAYFFKLLNKDHFNKLQLTLLIVSFALLSFNFLFIEKITNPDHLSGNLFTIVSYSLLILCMLYYLNWLQDDEDDLTYEPHFWVVTGLSIYVVINFFVFLFYVPMIKEDPKLADNIWNIHNIAYILLCIFIIKAFYVSPGHQLAN